MNVPSGLGLFRELPKEVLRIIVSFNPHQFWNLSKYFHSLSYQVLPLKEKRKALNHAAKGGYLDMLNNLLVTIINEL